MSFRGDVLTIGTGTGSILFYDLRTKKYMFLKDSASEVVFKTSVGWVVSEVFRYLVVQVVFIKVFYRHLTIPRRLRFSTRPLFTLTATTRAGRGSSRPADPWPSNERETMQPCGAE